ncbi:prephenate dehydratase domain-containing protein [Buchnera aphidicola (Mindarus keteleerifoliae)]|uniref:prephenate dehydratase domain-containing protein n=1 Tax=Buchnera aphidicola TaxID=9 RepID=UPI0031B702D9
MNSNDPLLTIRNKINLINKKLIILLSKRQSLTIKIAKIKLAINHSIKDKNREKNMIKQLINTGQKYGIKEKYISDIFNIIINQSISIQKKLLEKTKKSSNKNLSASFLGPKGSYSYNATLEYETKKNKKLLKKNCSNFKKVFQNVENNYSDIGIVPIENSCTGPISEIYNLLSQYNLLVIEKFSIPIEHCLLGISTASLNKIETIYSHSQPFKQCKKFISLFSNWAKKYVESTAIAMKQVSSLNLNNIAAIGSPIGANIYNLKIIKKNISNKINNFTKFVVLSKKKPLSLNIFFEKIMITFIIKNKSYYFISLFSLLEEHNIIVNKFELFCFQNSSKEKKMFLDIKSDLKNFQIEKFFQKIKIFVKDFKIVGTYKSI